MGRKILFVPILPKKKKYGILSFCYSKFFLNNKNRLEEITKLIETLNTLNSNRKNLSLKINSPTTKFEFL